LEKDEAPKRCDFLRLRNMVLKAIFPSSYVGMDEVKSAVTKKWLRIPYSLLCQLIGKFCF